MEEKNISKRNDDLLGYILSQLTEDVDRLKEDLYGDKEVKSLTFRLSVVETNARQIADLKARVDLQHERINVLEREDKESRLKIIIFLIILIFTYLTASIPKIVSILEGIQKII